MPNVKIKCFVLSDIHLEMLTAKQIDDFFKELTLRVDKHNPDVIVMAGDVTSLHNRVRLQTTFQRFSDLHRPMVYVAGNHEYYKYSITKGKTELEELSKAFSNLHVLTSGTKVDINGVGFVGDTLWYPKSKDWRLNGGITDHRLISDHQREVHRCYEDFVSKCVPTISKDCIVVTHHMPFNGCINQKFQDDPYNHFFMTDCSRFIDIYNAPRAWIHGHGHDPVDLILPTDTRVFSNPMAYVGEGTNPNFWDRMLVEL